MTSALLLARSGNKVAIVEQASRLAPTINGFVRKGAYFDTGFHYASMLGEGEFVNKLCSHLNILRHMKIRSASDNKGDLLIHVPTGFSFSFGESLGSFRNNLLESFPQESVNINKYLDEVLDYLELINSKSFDAVLSEEMFFNDGYTSLFDYLNNRFSSNQLKMILSVHSVLYGSNPIETSMQYHSMIAGGYYHQVQQVYDGGKAIVESYEKELTEAGVDIYLGVEVSKILLNEVKGVSGVEFVSQDKFETGNVVYSGHPALIQEMVPEGVFRPAYKNRLDKLEDTLSAFTVYCIDTSGQNIFLDHNNVILCKNDQNEPFWDDIEKGPVFISRSLSSSYEGGISLICPAQFEHPQEWKECKSFNRPQAYYSWKQETAEKLLGVVQESSPELAANLEIVEAASDLTFRDYMHAPGGCLYGVKHLVSDMHLLPRTRVNGLYLTGQATLTSGFAGAMISGYLTAMTITGEDLRKIIL